MKAEILARETAMRLFELVAESEEEARLLNEVWTWKRIMPNSHTTHGVETGYMLSLVALDCERRCRGRGLDLTRRDIIQRLDQIRDHRIRAKLDIADLERVFDGLDDPEPYEDLRVQLEDMKAHKQV